MVTLLGWILLSLSANAQPPEEWALVTRCCALPRTAEPIEEEESFLDPQAASEPCIYGYGRNRTEAGRSAILNCREVHKVACFVRSCRLVWR